MRDIKEKTSLNNKLREKQWKLMIRGAGNKEKVPIKRKKKAMTKQEKL